MTGPRSRRVPSALLAAGLLAATGALAGCDQPGLSNIASIASQVPPPPPPISDPAKLRAYTNDMSARYDAHPEDRAVAIRYAAALREQTQYAQAVAVMQQSAVHHPHDTAVLGAYGKALADDGRLQEAADVLARAHTPDRPNWAILSAQGSVADQMGKHGLAQDYYAAALKIAPDQAQVLSNLGLSYALERKMPLAEDTLRRATTQPNADMRVRQNLALVLVAEGKFDEAITVSQRDFSSVDAAENVEALKHVVAQSPQWSKVPHRTRRLSAPGVAKRDERTKTAELDLPQ